MENDNSHDSNIEESIKNLNADVFPDIKGYGWLLIILTLAIVFAAVFFAALVQNPMLILLPLAAIPVGLVYFEGKARNSFMRRFALITGFQYIPETEDIGSNVPYLQIGHDRYLSDVVSGNFRDYPLRFFNFNCTEGYGKSQRSIVFTAARLSYRASLPHIFLDAHHHFFSEDLIFELENPIDINVGGEIIKLEGDFNKYFTLYAPKGYEIETLQIFQPDTMAELIEYAKKFSLEFYGSDLYVYSRKVITSGKDLYALYDLVKFLAAELAPEIEKIRVEPQPA